MGVGRGAVTPWIFKHNTDKVEGGLMVLFFGLFSLPSPLEFFLPTPLSICDIYVYISLIDIETVKYRQNITETLNRSVCA